MNFRGYPLGHLPARALLAGSSWWTDLHMRLKRQYPATLGLPVLGPYVQFYREDSLFVTRVSLFNYFSTFLPSLETRIDYIITAYDRTGRQLGTGRVLLPHGTSAQPLLRDVIGQPLDAYGIFHVMAEPQSSEPSKASALGTTTGQFMTIYEPTDAARQAPQIIHSHKLFQTMPLPGSQITRRTQLTEEVHAQALTEFFFLNSCPMQTRVTLRASSAVNAAEVFREECEAPGWGVGRMTVDPAQLSSAADPVTFAFDFSRRVAHQKPILFRHQANGVVTCNHS